MSSRSVQLGAAVVAAGSFLLYLIHRSKHTMSAVKRARLVDEALEVAHEPGNSRFVVRNEAGEEAVLEYRAMGKVGLDARRASVPEDWPTRKVVEQLLSEALFRHARANGLKVRPSDDAVAAFLHDNVEMRDVLYEDPVVLHEPEQSRFAVKVADGSGDDAVLEYELRDGVMDLTHTFVPPVWRGCGVAVLLCLAAFRHCRAHDLRVIPSCSYIRDRFVPTHPEYADLIAGTSAL